MLTVKIYDRIADVPREAWDALHGDDDSPFVEWTWLEALEATKCATTAAGWTPRHIGVLRDGLLVAAAPAYIKTHSEGEFVFDWAWADVARRLGRAYYPKLVVAVPFTPAAGSRLLRAPGEDVGEVAAVVASAARAVAEKAGLSSAHVLFPHERECDALVAHGFARRAGVQFHWRNDGYATPEDFLARFQSKHRNAMKRERAQPSRDGTRIETLRGDAITPDLVDPMYGFYTATVDKFVWGRRYLNRAFFARVVERFRHRLEWVVARDASGTPIAGAFNVHRGRVLYGRYWGATEERPFLHFNVCYYHSIDECIRRGLAVFEPGAGGEHKVPRGFDPVITHSAHWIADAVVARPILDFLRREAEAVREHVAQERAASPLHRKDG